MPISQRKKVNICAALCAAGNECSLPPAQDSGTWCHRHNEERLKLYTNYKAHGELLKAYPNVPECYNVATIISCDSLSTLREWNGHLRGKYNLLTRCIEARVCFARRFFGEDMDFGHKVFWDNLVQKRSDVERLMSHIEKRGYQLILEGQSALWVLEQEPVRTEDCSSFEGFAKGSNTSFRPTDSAEDVPVEDPLEAIYARRLLHLKRRSGCFLLGFAPPRRRGFMTSDWKSYSYDSVMDLLNDRGLDYVTTEKIWEAFDSLHVHDVRSAVDDVVRSTGGEHMVVLGGKVFKDASGQRWPLHAWGHMMSIRRCYSCLRMICQTIDQVIDLNRYALLTGAPLSQTYIKYDFRFDGSKELILAGFIPSDMPFSSPRHSIICQDSGSHATDPVWEETQRNLYLFGSLSLGDPMAQAFVNACIRHPDFMVMLRKGPGARIIRSSPGVWISRKRYAQSPSALASVPWEKAVEVISLPDPIFDLEGAWPLGWAREKIVNCLQVIIVDVSEGSMGDLVRKLVGVWCRIYKVGGKDRLYNFLESMCGAEGELEEYEEVSVQMALDHYYQDLWGCRPGPPFVDIDCF